MNHAPRRPHEGMDFSPHFQKDGLFYVYYSPKRRRTTDQPFTVVSQFKAVVTSDGFEANLSSEMKLLEIAQPAKNHKGGMLAFWGEDLYIGVGDGGGWDDQGETRPYDRSSHNNGQNLNTWLAKILRIRPNGRGSYSVPSDNPYVGQTLRRPEIFAFGVRNPWRFSFDRQTGEMWLGDVGQGSFEEISIVKKGDNLGWSIYEGNIKCPGCDANQRLVGGVHKEPLFTYNHTIGKSITGGYVYRGKAYSELFGKYIFSDFEAGTLWSLDFSSSNAEPKMFVLAQSSNVASLGEDQDGELYVLSMREGILSF
jgi:glucose/arabinose dehydrogenase